MALATTTKQQIIGDHARSEGDSGSSEVQISLLTRRINDLTGHLRTHRHDYHSRRGLIMMVGRRNRLLRYLQRTDRDRYLALIQKLGLRK